MEHEHGDGLHVAQCGLELELELVQVRVGQGHLVDGNVGLETPDAEPGDGEVGEHEQA